MKTKTFYRVGNLRTMDGLWYDHNGTFHGRIHNDLKALSASSLVMPFDPAAIGYLSCTDSLEDLHSWFNEDDLKILNPLDYFIIEYESTDYFEYQGHWMFNQNPDTYTVVATFKSGYSKRAELILEVSSPKTKDRYCLYLSEGKFVMEFNQHDDGFHRKAVESWIHPLETTTLASAITYFLVQTSVDVQHFIKEVK